jgi:hypothetical protein
MSAFTNITTETEIYITFKYHLFRKVTAQLYTFIGIGESKGLPQQTLDIVLGSVDGFINDIVDDLPGCDATMSRRISIYKVLNLHLFTRTVADPW